MNIAQSYPTKILHLHTRAVVGGSGTNVLLTLEKLPREKFCGHLACGNRDSQDAFLKDAESKNIRVHFIEHLINRINPLYDLCTLFEIIRLIKKEKYTIVHTHNSKAGILGRLAAKICGVPVVVHTIHSCEFNYEGIGPFLGRFYIFLEKVAVWMTDRFIAISPHLKKEFLKYRIARDEDIEIVYSGIEIEKFRNGGDAAQKRKELGLDADTTVISIVARMEHGKGHVQLIEAIPEIVKQKNEVMFLFVGDGPLKSRLEDAVKDGNMYRAVRFTGLRLDVVQILKASDIVCIPSLYEGMGRVVLEAQAAGKPVVANRTGGIPDIVDECTTAILAEVRDRHSLIAALCRLIKDENLRRQMGKAAAAFIDQRFSAEKMVKDIEKIYDSLLQEGIS